MRHLSAWSTTINMSRGIQVKEEAARTSLKVETPATADAVPKLPTSRLPATMA